MAGKSPASRMSDEEKGRLAGGEAAAKKAGRLPAGDTEHSGAAPGIKARTDESVVEDTVATFEEPAKARTARRRAEKSMDEVREIQHDVQTRNLLENVPPENVRTVYATNDTSSKKDPDSLTFAYSSGGMTLYTTSNELTFSNRDDALAVARAASQIAANL